MISDFLYADKSYFVGLRVESVSSLRYITLEIRDIEK